MKPLNHTGFELVVLIIIINLVTENKQITQLFYLV